MTENLRKGFRTVADNDTDDYKKKLRAHRFAVVKRTLIAILVVAAVVFGVAIFMMYRSYEDYDSLESVERTDSEAMLYVGFQSNILKYSNDGAAYTYMDDELIWNQTYEMSDPQISICEGYLSIYDKGGMDIYIFTKDGQQGYIETTMPINQVCVASQGTVAVLMQKSSSGYLALYDKSGNNLAEGELHGENGGYPIAIALSHDAQKLAVSLLDISEGIVKSTIAFYNYGSVGQNEIDRCVGMTSFEDMVVPEMVYTKDDSVVAFGDSEILVFEGSQKPQLSAEIELEKEVKSIFYNDNYFGIVVDSDAEEVGRSMNVYDRSGRLVMGQDFEGDCENVGLMTNNEIVVLNNNVCDLYTMRGVHKFHYEFDEDVKQIIPEVLGLNYIIVRDKTTERVRLK
jgi:hypothetical protein